jgi:hypothetical protein
VSAKGGKANTRFVGKLVDILCVKIGANCVNKNQKDFRKLFGSRSCATHHVYACTIYTVVVQDTAGRIK